MQNRNVVYIIGEWCSKQRERSFYCCWNLFVCNTAIVFLSFFLSFFNLPFKFVGAVFNIIVNNMFIFILCASVFLICFSILIFALIIYIIFFYFCWKSSFFYAIYKNDGRIKKYLSDRSFFLYLQISLELEKVHKKIVIFYYISGYHFTFFFLLYFLWFCSFFTFFFCPYFLIYIIFLFKLLLFFSFSFSKFYIEFKKTMERESLH
jgi:hypothetical protein